jgi:hypothetical protein
VHEYTIRPRYGHRHRFSTNGRSFLGAHRHHVYDINTLSGVTSGLLIPCVFGKGKDEQPLRHLQYPDTHQEDFTKAAYAVMDFSGKPFCLGHWNQFNSRLP